MYSETNKKPPLDATRRVDAPEMSNGQACDEFYKILGDIERRDPAYREHPVLKKLEEDTEENDDWVTAVKQLKKMLAKRDDVLDQIQITWRSKEFEADKETINQYGREIKVAISNPDGFLGNGAVAEVYTYRRENRNLCVKWVIDEEKLLEGATLEKELHFLDLLRNLKVEGVRTPKPLFAFKTGRMKGIVMEQLKATCFQRVLERQTTEGIADEFPSTFDIDDYFNRVGNYLKAMHRQGIFHGDIALRNLMINRETGLPYVIDFGKGSPRRKDQILSKNEKIALANNDLVMLREAKERAIEDIKRLGL